ncbi:MAG: type II secretion system protein F [Acidobacteria bacterium]|nr:type II secretion system protein F [Acidobacteriota bacterium]
MSALLGAMGGAGLFLLWWSLWNTPPSAPKPPRRDHVRELLLHAGIEKVSTAGFVVSTLLLGIVAFLIFFIFSGAAPIAVCFALFAAWMPVVAVRWRANRRQKLLQQLWPDVVDHLRSAIRAGLSLPEALSQLGEKGPEELRYFFADFASDYRASGQFDGALNRLRDRLADPVADRIFAALKLTREVGGSQLGNLLATLSEFLRDSARMRSELEARQSWTVNAARLAIAAPWMVLLLLATRPEAIAAYNSAAGWLVLAGGLLVSVICYRVMLRIGTLPADERVLG